MRLVILLCVSIFWSSCAAQKFDGWEEFTAEDAGFRASLPCKPAKEVREYNYKVGKVFGYEFLCNTNALRFRISFGDHNPETGESVQKFLEYSQGDIEIGFKDFIQTKDNIHIDSHPGRRYVMNPGGGRYIITAVTSNEKGILHATLGPVSMPVTADEEKTFKRMIDSIHFLSK